MSVPSEDLRDLAELLQASSAYVQLQAEANRARDLAVKLARRVLRDWKITDEEAIRLAGERAVRSLAPPKIAPKPKRSKRARRR